MNTGNDNNNHPLIKKEKEEKEEQQQCINISCRLGEERAWVVLLRATMERLERERMADAGRELERSLQVVETRLQQKQQLEAAAEPAPRTRGQARALVATAEERVRVAVMTRRAMVRAWSLAFGLTEARVMPSAAIDIVSVEALADEDNYAFEPMCFTSVNRRGVRCRLPQGVDQPLSARTSARPRPRAYLPAERESAPTSETAASPRKTSRPW